MPCFPCGCAFLFDKNQAPLFEFLKKSFYLTDSLPTRLHQSNTPGKIKVLYFFTLPAVCSNC
jgi:hypothetical protein